MKIALVHDYLTQRGGAERVFELLVSTTPTLTFSHLCMIRKIDLRERLVHTTVLQNIPGQRSILI